MRKKISVTLLYLSLIVLSGCVPTMNSVNESEKSDKPNIIMIQLEAFQSFVLQKEINGEQITPNLNRLIKESAYFSNFYLQNGGGSTSDAEFMANTSLHPFKSPNSIAMDAVDKEYNSLPRLLKGQGYQTTTLHTNNVMFWNRKEFYSALGFDSYYDKSYFGSDNIIAFGADDDVLYDKGVQILSDLNRPFYAQLISMSSHYPFQLPDGYKEMDLPDVYKNNMIGDYIHATHYADAALGRFFENLKENNLWNNTVIVIYGDHTGLQTEFVKERENAAFEELTNRKYDKVDALQIPLIIYGKNILPGEYKQAGGHLDIMPTLTNLLGLEINGEVFGYDLFGGVEHAVSIRSSFAEEGSYAYGNYFYDAADNSVTMIDSRKELTSTEIDFQKIKEQQVQNFNKSDQIIKSLPQKKDSFGVNIELTEESQVRELPSMNNPVTETLPVGTQLTTFKNTDDWYMFRGKDGKEYWVKTNNPIQEIYQLVESKESTHFYSEPDEHLKPRLKTGPQVLYGLREWKDKGWYQVSVWTGEELWVKLD